MAKVTAWGRRGVFGVRFRDPLTGRTVRDGLTAVLWETGTEGLSLALAVNREGIFVVDRLPNGAAAGSLAADAPYAVAVRDRLGRYLPMRYALGPCNDGDFVDRTLTSGPARPPADGFAMVRAQFVVGKEAPEAEPVPAPFAVATVTLADGTTAWSQTGVADERGCMALLLPYPPAGGSLSGKKGGGGDGSGGGGGATEEPVYPLRVGWSMALTVKYQPANVTSHGEHPTACDRASLDSQAQAVILTGAGTDVTGGFTFTLHFGQEEVLRSADDKKPVLRIRLAT